MMRKGLAVAVILLFVGVAFAPSINAEIESNESIYTDFLDDGSLSGYVYDNNMEPIEGALVRVYFHETYEENYTNSYGYYHVTNIPICWCMKNCTASKEDYVTEWVYLSIGESTTYNFVLERDDSDLVEFDVEFSGLGKKHTVKLTQQEAEDVELLFDNLQDRLFAVESDDEAMVIFNEAVVELDKYGLLGELSVKQAQRLVTFQYQRFKNSRFLQRIVNAEKLDDNENSFCLIYGQITYAILYRIRLRLNLHLYININPLKLLSSVSIGRATSSFEGPSYHYPSEGSIWTNGTNGNIQWDGLLKGDIDLLFYEFSFMYYYYIGIKGFNGIQITINETTTLLGFARQVKIRNYW